MQETAAHHLILLRHGKTEINEWNEKNPTAKRIGGQRESPLTHEGIEDAVQAGKRIATMPYNIVLAVSSDIERAVMTRDLVLKELEAQNIPVVSIPVLREISYGSFEEKTEEEMRREHPEFFENPDFMNWRGDFEQKAPDGENYADIGERLKDLEPHLNGENGEILVVSHLHVSRVLLHRLLGLTKEEACRLKIPNTTPIVIERGKTNRLIGEVTLQCLLAK